MLLIFNIFGRCESRSHSQTLITGTHMFFRLRMNFKYLQKAAEDVFASKEEADAWLSKANFVLQDKTPIEAAKTEEGFAQVGVISVSVQKIPP